MRTRRSDSRTIDAMARGDEMAHRLMTIPGLGPVRASAMAASIQDVSAFSGPREFAAFPGLTPCKKRLVSSARCHADSFTSTSLSCSATWRSCAAKIPSNSAASSGKR
ncbi:MAG TPA: transposase [Methylocella sp.]